ncbi:MAG: sulfite exporter TauE/SafE family protein [Peptostreptococcaceae bacterium]
MQETIYELIPIGQNISIPMIFAAIFLISFFGAFIGGITGLGGGMLIKPMLGNILYMSATKISLYISKFISTTVVFSMSAKSANMYRKSGFEYNLQLFMYISIGLILGIFSVDFLPFNIPGDIEVLLQGILYVLVFISVLLRDKYPKLNFTNNHSMTILIGFLIGFLSSFFGIGGGAIKVPFFLIFFSFTMKEAAIYSFLVGLVTEPLKLVQYGFHINNFTNIGPEALKISILLGLISVPAAILGATFGVSIQKKASDKFVANSFNAVIIYFAIISIASGISMINGNGPLSIFTILL